MFVMNSVTSDPRVTREAETLAKSGYDVVVIGFSEDDRKDFSYHGYKIILLKKSPSLLSIINFRKLILKPKDKVQYSGQANKEIVSSFIDRGTFISRMINTFGWIVYNVRSNISMALAGIKVKASIYHSHDLDTLLAGYLCSRFNRAKIVYDFHEAYTKQESPGTKTKLWGFFYTQLERLFINKMDVKITVCNSLRDWAIKTYGTNNIEVIMNVSKYTNSPSAEKRTSEKIVLYHGGFYKDRGIEQLIESVKYVNSAKLILRGWGSTETILRSIVKKEMLEDKVEFVPPVKMEDLVKYASEADIGVIP